MNTIYKEKWLRLYEVAQLIGALNPWRDFAASDRFVYLSGEKAEPVYFSFISAPTGGRGIACYRGENDYLRARRRLTWKNEKDEPTFCLQNAWIALWDDRTALSRNSYTQIRELGFGFRGRGAWLHFDRYAVGYAPVPIDARETDWLTDQFGNLHMMLRAVYEQGLNPEFDAGKALVRWYEPKDKLYYTHPLAIPLNESAILRPVATLRENDWVRQVRWMSVSACSVEMDWWYLDCIYADDDGRETYPRLLVAVDTASGCMLAQQLLAPSHNQPGAAVSMLGDLVERYGKPAELRVCDPDLHSILADACRKFGMHLLVKKRLPAIKVARETLAADWK